MGDPLQSDKRFRHIATDPRFRSVPRSERKVKIDRRFEAMFTDDKFKLEYAVDKRGRPVEQTQADNLKKYYELSSGDEEGSDSSSEDTSSDDEKPQQAEQSQTEDLPAPSSSKVKTSKKDRLRELSKSADSAHKERMREAVAEQLKDLTVDYARGIGTLGSDQSSSDESSSEDSEDDVVHAWGELDRDAERTDDISSRLAVCNLDWDRITAKDLLVLFTSFLPPEGFVKSVAIYPSEYGLQRMKEEELKGPKELFEDPKFEDFDDQDFTDKHSEGSQYCMEKLREYQLNRLKYYYAVVALDSSETANKVYTECDGNEYESSATKLDLRFIPDDMEFDQEPKETCDSMPDITKYKPRRFVNSALQQGTVSLTWDETDMNRVEFTRKLAGGANLNEDDLRAYIAASSDSDDENGEAEGNKEAVELTTNDPIAKYKALLTSVTANNEKRKNKVDMKVSWGVGLGGEDSSGSEIGGESEEEEQQETAVADKSKKRGKKSKALDTPEDQQQSAELQLLLADDEVVEAQKAHFNFKDIQKQESSKNKKRKHRKSEKPGETAEGDFKIDVNDGRFSALYTSHHFNIDPADPRFVRTEAADKIIKEKQKRRKVDDVESQPAVAKSEKRNMNPEFASLLKSIKRKQSGS